MPLACCRRITTPCMAPSPPPTVGVEAEAEMVSKLLSELEGKNIAEVMAAGREKLQSVPSGGGAASAAPAAGGGGGAAPAKEEKKEEPSEEDEVGWG